MNALYKRFARLAGRQPRRQLVREGPDGKWLTGGDCLRRSGRLAAELKSGGVGRGSIVLVATGNRPAFIDAVLALWSLDAVVLPIEESHTQDEIERIRSVFAPTMEIRAGNRSARATAEILSSRGAPLTARHHARYSPALEASTRRSRTRIPAPAHGGSQLIPGAALIRMTSGSTGTPRGAIVTAAQAAADGRAIVRAMSITPEDLNLAAIPLSHSYGFDNIVLPLVMQGTPALLIARPLPGIVLRALRSRRPVVLPAVPYLLNLLARHPDAPSRRTALRLCISAAAPLPPATASAFRARFGVPVRNFYGSSETGGIAYDDSPEGIACDDDTGGTVETGFAGTPLPGVTITINRRGLRGLPPGEGRVVVSGPAVASRYFPENSPDLVKGRFRTSDIGRLDERGRLHLTGRLTSLINVAGRKVNPDDVERALLDLGGVVDAAVMGIADPLRGEQVVAWVVTRGGTDEPRIRSEVAQRLSRHEQPRILNLVRRIPRTARGKVDRQSLLESHTARNRPRTPSRA